MKYTLIVLIVALLTIGTASYGGYLDEGTRTIRADAVYDDEAGHDDSWGWEVGLGGALWTLDDAGIFAGYRDNSDREFRSVGGYVEEHYPNPTPLIPFIGLGVGWGWQDPSSAVLADDNSVFVRGQVGLKILLHDSVALSLTWLYTWADEDLFLEGDEFDDTNSEGAIGLRFYY